MVRDARNSGDCRGLWGIVGASFHICNVARRMVVDRLREVAEMRRRVRPREPRVS